MNKDMEWIKTGYFAHRGLHNGKDIPENSMRAFFEAIDNGYDIECDIQLTKDKQMVVFHDEHMKRLCNINKRVQDENYDDIKDCKILNTNETMPLLTELLDSIPVTTKLLIELKPHKNKKEVVRYFLEIMENYSNTFAIHSFDPGIVYQFRKQAPKIIRGQIAQMFTDRGLLGKLAGHLVFNRFTKPDWINYGIKDLPRKKLDRLKARGLVICSYTARSEEELAFVRKHYHNAVFEHFKPVIKQKKKT